MNRADAAESKVSDLEREADAIDGMNKQSIYFDCSGQSQQAYCVSTNRDFSGLQSNLRAVACFHACHRLHVFHAWCQVAIVFPRLTPDAWFPALGTRMYAFRAWHQVAKAFPRLSPDACFPGHVLKPATPEQQHRYERLKKENCVTVNL